MMMMMDGLGALEFQNSNHHLARNALHPTMVDDAERRDASVCLSVSSSSSQQ